MRGGRFSTSAKVGSSFSSETEDDEYLSSLKVAASRIEGRDFDLEHVNLEAWSKFWTSMRFF